MAKDPLLDFDEHFNAYRAHLDRSEDNAALEPLFIRLLLVDAQVTYENIVRGAIDRIAEQSCDAKFIQYLDKRAQKFGKPFDAIPLNEFLKSMKYDTSRGISPNEAKEKYHKLIDARNKAAHGEEPGIKSLDELREMHRIAKTYPQACAEKLRRRFGHRRR